VPCPSCGDTMAYSTTVTNYDSRAESVRVKANFGGKSFVIGSARVAPGAHATLKRNQPIGQAHLWSIYDPFLYKLVISASANGAKVEPYRMMTGVRSIKVVSGHLELNYQPLDLRGVGTIDDSPTTGAALSDAQRDKTVALIRQAGAHLLREHYPMDPYLLEQADKYGILVWSEVPVYSMESSELAQPAVRKAAVQMLLDNITTNGNHPAVAVWSVANELDPTPGAPETAYYDEAAAAAHAADPTRPVGAAIQGYPTAGCQAGYRNLDVLGLNDYFGWYPGPAGSLADWDLLGDYFDEAHACYPTKALIVTEFGAEANRSGPVEERGTYQFQQAFVDQQLTAMESKPYLSGVDYWTLQEYKVKPGWSGGNPYPTPPLGQKGLVSFAGVPKPAFTDIQTEYTKTKQILPLGTPPNG
jgi:beta-glucuronidase